jgi:hypothetical protein
VCAESFLTAQGAGFSVSILPFRPRKAGANKPKTQQTIVDEGKTKKPLVNG